MAKRKSRSKNFPAAGKKFHRPSKRLSEADLYEAEEKATEEENNPHKFDGAEELETFELNSDFEDEEIDEDAAFNAEDKAKYGEWFGDDGENDEEEEEGFIDPDVLETGGDDFDDVDELFGDDVVDEEDLEVEYEEDDDDDGKHTSLIASVIGKKDGGGGKRKKRKVATELVPESEFNVTPIGGGELTVSDLMATMGKQRGELGATHKALESLAMATPVGVPMPRVIQERQTRKAGYTDTKRQLKKWNDVIQTHRAAPTLEFSAPTTNVKSVNLHGFVEDFKPQNDMEKEVAELLKKAGATAEEDIEQEEDKLAMKELSMEELQNRREHLAKMRSLLFFHERKAKHIAKIKSKEYHRRLQRRLKKQSIKFSDLPEDEAARKLAEEMEFKRAEERLTLRHSTMNRWARRVLRRGLTVADENTKEALMEQIRQGQELKKKMEKMDGKNSDSETDASDSESGDEAEDAKGGPSYKKTRKAVLNVLEGRGDPQEVPKKGLFALPFMRKAMERRKEEARLAANNILNELDEENEDATGAENSGRLLFSGVTPRKAQNGVFGGDDDAVDAKADEMFAEKTVGLDEDKSGDEEERGIDPRAARKLLSLEARKLVPECAQGINAGRQHLFVGSSSTERKGRAAQEVDPDEVQKAGKFVRVHTEQPAAIDLDDLVEVEEDDAEASNKDEVTANGNHDNHINESGSMMKLADASNQSQQELIEMAFEGDDVGAEFAEEKAQEVEKELPAQEEVSTLPGWGAWGNQKKAPKWMTAARDKSKREREKAAAKRRDARKGHVIISEKLPKKSTVCMADGLPVPFKTKEAYEHGLRHPLGMEFNTMSSFADLTRPAVVKRAGVLIDPIRYSDPLKEELEDMQANYKPSDLQVAKIVEGGVAEYKRFPHAEEARKKRDELNKKARILGKAFGADGGGDKKGPRRHGKKGMKSH